MSAEIGKRLRQARESLGLSLEELEAQTRIHKNYLLALENGQFDLLPSPIYVRSYIRSYANAVGENPQVILKNYRPVTRTSSQKESSSFKSTERSYGVSLPPTSSERLTPTARSQEPVRQQRDLTATQSYTDQFRERYRSTAAAEEQHFDSYRSQTDFHTRKTSSRDWQQLEEPQPKITRARRSREAGLSQTSGYSTYSSARRVENEDSPSYLESSYPSARSSVRRPSMPPDLPAPEDLGLDQDSEQEDLYPQRSRSAEIEEVKSGFSFGKLYTWLLILGSIALVVAVVWFLVLRSTDASQPDENDQTKQSVEADSGNPDANQSERKPILTVLTTNPNGVDHYELVNTDQLELKIVSNGGSSKFEVRDQEVGDPLVASEVTSGKEFSKAFPTGIWLKLSDPRNVTVTINGKPVATQYDKPKEYHISFVK